MQVLDPNDVKIYNLSSGKSIPDWISDRKKRRLKNKDIDIRRRIELIQDFEMPGVSTTVKISADGQYILATGIYKPRVRCYDVNNLSMKFERCFDSEVVTFEMLSDDYSKIAFLESDRYIELHASGGRYYRFRVPSYGRDLKYHFATCDLLIAGGRGDVYRMNLERGQFLEPWAVEGGVNCLAINSAHRLVVAGCVDGKVRAWDPRTRVAASATLDVALHCSTEAKAEGLASITSLKFDGPLTLGVGTATGQALLYDLRSSLPKITKDHMYGLPICDMAFSGDKVLSLDSSILKIWDSADGKMMTFIESGKTTQFNSLCHVPRSGLLFMANENTKILSYYIPRLAPAPRWCSFLDNLTEELEESRQETVYDDYKFLTKAEIEDLGLGHILGTNMARAYMHGYFVDVRLWRKAKEASEPFKYDEYRKKKLKEKLEAERPNRVQINKLPKVNKELALKLMDSDSKNASKKKPAGSALLSDDRFKAMFENPDFQVDPHSEEYRLLNPVLSRLDSSRKKELQKAALKEQFELVDDGDGPKSSDEDMLSSSDDEREWAEEVRQQHRALRKERAEQERLREAEEEAADKERRAKARSESQRAGGALKMFQLREGVNFAGINSILSGKTQTSRLPLGERMTEEDSSAIAERPTGNKESSFIPKRRGKKRVDTKAQMLKHKMERKQIARKVPLNMSSKPWKR